MRNGNDGTKYYFVIGGDGLVTIKSLSLGDVGQEITFCGQFNDDEKISPVIFYSYLEALEAIRVDFPEHLINSRELNTFEVIEHCSGREFVESNEGFAEVYLYNAK